MDRDDVCAHRDARLVRGVVIAVWAFALLAAVLCFVPSVEVYRGASDGAEQYLGLQTPVDHPAGYALYFLGLALPGLAVYRRPRMRAAFGWSLIAFAATFLLLVVTFEISFSFERRVYLPLAQVYAFAASGTVILLMAVVPLGCVGFAIARAVQRRRRVAKPELPRARVIPR